MISPQLNLLHQMKMILYTTKNLFYQTLRIIYGNIANNKIKFSALDPLLLFSFLVISSFLLCIYHIDAINYYKKFFIIFLILSLCGYYIFYNLYLGNLFLAIIIIILGIIYFIIYDAYFNKHLTINKKLYVNVTGQISNIKKVTNSKSKSWHVILTHIELSKITKKNSKKEKSKNKSKSDIYNKRNIYKHYTNLSQYIDIDRLASSYDNQYLEVNWISKNNKYIAKNPPKKVTIIIPSRNLSHTLKIGDVISANVFFSNKSSKIFPSDFDFNIYNKSLKISGFGIATSDIFILSSNSNLGFFEKLRITISSKIDKHLTTNQSAIAKALLIGDKSEINNELNKNIINSGISHLLSISGFHIALAGSFFFIISRYILSRNEFITLNYNIKFIAGFIAIIACFFYLNISGAKIPTQRAFLIALIGFLAMLKYEKLNLNRALGLIAIIIILINPYNVVNIGFQLSFLAVYIIINFTKKSDYIITSNLINKYSYYFGNIILISFLIQFYTAPLLLYSFSEISTLSPITNIIAIPVTSFITMPLGFISLLLMPLNLEKYTLQAMGYSINIIELSAYFISNIKYSYISLSKISGYCTYLLFIIFILISITNSKIRYLLLSIYIITTIYMINLKKYDLAFDPKQNFFVINKKNEISFSKNVRSNKYLDKWLNYYNKKYTTNDSCKNYCNIEIKNKRFLIITSRVKKDIICNTNYDYIINLSKKYSLGECANNKKKIENIDFKVRGGHFLTIGSDVKVDYSNQ